MDLAAKKLAFIEEYLHLSNEKLIDKLAAILRREKKSENEKKTLVDFYGIMSSKVGKQFMRNIKEGCENIDTNEW